jgi:hypothetical protein
MGGSRLAWRRRIRVFCQRMVHGYGAPPLKATFVLGDAYATALFDHSTGGNDVLAGGKGDDEL